MKKKKLEKSKYAAFLRGLCLMHDNAGAHTYKLVLDFLSTVTVEQLHNPPYSPRDYALGDDALLS